LTVNNLLDSFQRPVDGDRDGFAGGAYTVFIRRGQVIPV
jgi:hypothetical protein